MSTAILDGPAAPARSAITRLELAPQTKAPVPQVGAVPSGSLGYPGKVAEIGVEILARAALLRRPFGPPRTRLRPSSSRADGAPRDRARAPRELSCLREPASRGRPSQVRRARISCVFEVRYLRLRIRARTLRHRLLVHQQGMPHGQRGAHRRRALHDGQRFRRRARTRATFGDSGTNSGGAKRT
jgi:hypothetical protein